MYMYIFGNTLFCTQFISKYIYADDEYVHAVVKFPESIQCKILQTTDVINLI